MAPRFEIRLIWTKYILMLLRCLSPVFVYGIVFEDTDVYIVAGIGDDVYFKQVTKDWKKLHPNVCAVFWNKSAAHVDSSDEELIGYPFDLIVYYGADTNETVWKRVHKVSSAVSGGRTPYSVQCDKSSRLQASIAHGGSIIPCSGIPLEMLGVTDEDEKEFVKLPPLDLESFIKERKNSVEILIGPNFEAGPQVQLPLDKKLLEENEAGYVVLHDKNNEVPNLFIWCGPKADKHLLVDVVNEAKSFWKETYKKDRTDFLVTNAGSESPIFKLYFKNEDENHKTEDL